MAPSTRSSSITMHRYESREAIYRTLELEIAKDGGRVTFCEVPPQVMDDISEDHVKLISFFDKEEKNITMKLLSLEHQMATIAVDKMLKKALKRCGTMDAIIPAGMATAPYTPCQSESVKSGKQPDASYQLRPQYTEAEGQPLKDWPQIVIETGCSESDRSLRVDLKRWMDHSENAVRLVLLVNITSTWLRVTAWTTPHKPGQIGYEGKIEAKLAKDRFRVKPNARIRVPFRNIFFRDERVGERPFELWGSDLEEASEDLAEVLSGGWADPQEHRKPGLPAISSGQQIPLDALPDWREDDGSIQGFTDVRVDADNKVG